MTVKNIFIFGIIIFGGAVLSDHKLIGWSCIIIGSILYIVGYNDASEIDDNKEAITDTVNEEEKNAVNDAIVAAKAARREKAAMSEEEKMKATSEYKQIERIDSNLSTLMSMDFPKPIEFKNNVFENEKSITDKGGNDVIHKLVKIYTFLDDMWAHLTKVRQEMRDDVVPNSLYTSFKESEERRNNRSDDEILADTTEALRRASRGDIAALNDSPAHHLRRMEETTEAALDVLPEEIAKVAFIEAIANSMLIFLLADKKFHYFEILEVFDKLGVLDSSWQKSVAKKMDSIESKLDLLIGGIFNLNENIDRLIEKDEEIIKQLQSIDSSIATNNMLQAITAYQVYKIR